MDEDAVDFATRIRNKDEQALVEFIELRRPQLLGFIQRNLSTALGRKLEAADILQDVSLSAVTSLSTFDLGDRDPFSWLCQLAEHRIIDAHRKLVAAQKRSADREVHGASGDSDTQRGGFINLIVASMTTPSGALSRDQREYRLLEALKNLSEESQKALRLRYVEGLPSKEIASQLGRTDGATRVLLTRSLAKLQELLRHESDFASFINPPPREG
ncbi:MAG TPA: sigma-70 family RNA polymerase sigma factor [Planctomycetaceae bacterium]|jgi:RNA polymerase sigma-70 factor (ECF subfamily)|nr:sigma-70 family RNA polymerase sigma factor [Planctomycetaceae bacterium]